MDEQSNSVTFPVLQNQRGVNDIYNHLFFRFRTAVLFFLLFLTKLQGLEINPVGERGAAHLIAALHTDAVVGGMLQALHSVGKGWHWGDFSGHLLAI